MSVSTEQKSPIMLADELGRKNIAASSPEHQKLFGIYLTPILVAEFMASLSTPKGTIIKILDPAAGAGILSCTAIEHLIAHNKGLREIHLDMYELDPIFAKGLKNLFTKIKKWALSRGVELNYRVLTQDFVLAHADALTAHDRNLTLFPSSSDYDLVIANPPYFKISKDDPRAKLSSQVVHGQPNIYALFMAISACLLKKGGQFVFITPRSFSSGPYFEKFRHFFFERIRPLQIHLFRSRRDAFRRDDVLQENVIIHGIRDEGWSKRKRLQQVTISTSAGSFDLEASSKRKTSLDVVLDPSDCHRVFRVPVEKAEEEALRLVHRWTGSLRKYGLAISTGPVVPFRATSFLLSDSGVCHAPLIWMNHVRAMELHWPNGTKKPQYILSDEESRYLLVPNRNYVLLRRFSAKEEARRLTAAPLLAHQIKGQFLGLENHLNYIHRPDGELTEDEVWGLTALLSSTLLDTYFRCCNGNTQVSATELRAMPLPSIEAIVRLGRKVKQLKNPLGAVDELLLSLMTDANTIRPEPGEAAVA